MVLRRTPRLQVLAQPPATRALAPAMVPLIRAQNEGRDVSDLAASAARTYASRGDSLTKYLDDLDLCLQVGGSPPASQHLLEATQSAWADVFTARYDDVSCLHEPSGLMSVHHLQRHVRYHLSAEDPAALVLIVSELARHDAHPAAISAMNTQLAQSLPDAELLVHLGRRRSAALMVRTLSTSSRSRALKRALRSRFATYSGPGAPRVWIEGLPLEPNLAALAVDEICR